MKKASRGESLTLSVVVPAYNEEARIKDSLHKITAYLKRSKRSFEVIVVDDGSSDGTALSVEAIAAKMKNIRLVKNGVKRGKGYSIRRGIMRASGEFILTSDADLSTPIEEVERLLDAVVKGGCEVAIGSRALPQSRVVVRQTIVRQSMGKLFNLLVQALVMRGIRDTQCGFKCFVAEAAREIFGRQEIDGFCFDVEVLLIARKLGYRIKEVPVVWINFPPSSVHIIREPLRMFGDLLRISFCRWQGQYDASSGLA